MAKFLISFFLLLSPTLILALNDPGYLIPFLVSVFLLFIAFYIIRSSRNLYALLPFLWLVPFSIYYSIYYQKSIDVFALSVIFDTNWYEVKGYLGEKVYLIILLFCAWVGLTTFYLWGLRNKKEWSFGQYSSLKVSAVLSVALVVSCAASYMTQSSVAITAGKSVIEKLLGKTYPLGAVISIYSFIDELSMMQEQSRAVASYKFNAVQLDEADQKQIVVLVIGETSRRSNWQLNGYERNTTPQLSKQANLINFRDMISLAPATIISIPMMITRKPEEDMNKFSFGEPSVTKVFKEVGFSTYWLSTQQKNGKFDSLTSTYANQSDRIQFFNHSISSNSRDMDEVLIPKLKEILSKPEKKQFIVIHTLGSHQQYDARYPTAFNVFRPSSSDLKYYDPQSERYRTETINSFDNTVLYTDHVLNSFIEELKKTHSSSMLFYASDHGEDLFDGQCGKSGHGANTKYNFEVPAFIWMSNEYIQANPDRVNSVRAKIDFPMNHTSIFPSLIDSVGITIPNYNPSRSLFQDIDKYKRIILNGVDFDAAKKVGSCSEMKFN